MGCVRESQPYYTLKKIGCQLSHHRKKIEEKKKEILGGGGILSGQNIKKKLRVIPHLDQKMWDQR